jgi:hypothetical protein
MSDRDLPACRCPRANDRTQLPRRSGAAAIFLLVVAGAAVASAQQWRGVLHEHPAIGYLTRPTTDRIGALSRAIADGTKTLARDPRTGYLRPLLDALNIPIESQLRVFSRTGVQRDHTGPRNPRALFFDRSVVVGYIPGAPMIEIASHDPQQGMVFYTIAQAAPRPAVTRQTMCLTCHVSASTLEVPGVISRSNAVDDEGNVLPQLGSNDVTHETSHPDRWGGWFVTSEGVPAPYNQRAHEGNITFSRRGNTSSQVFIDWMNSEPESRGYLSPQSDIVSLLVFDHQMHAINLLTRLNWEARLGAAAEVQRLAEELGDYLLFTGEVPPTVPLVALPGFAAHLEASAPKDHLGRSFGQMDLDRRLMRYPCSFMIYSDAFGALPAGVQQAVYRRMLERLTTEDTRRAPQVRLTATDRAAVLEILRDTKPDFPQS